MHYDFNYIKHQGSTFALTSIRFKSTLYPSNLIINLTFGGVITIFFTLTKYIFGPGTYEHKQAKSFASVLKYEFKCC